MIDIYRKKDVVYGLVILILITIPVIISWNSKTQLEAITESGSLKLVTRNSPSTYYLEKGVAAGFEYELATAFAKHLGVSLELIIPKDFNSIFTTIEQRNGHIAAAMLTITDQRKRKFEFSPSYLNTATSLIYRVTQGRKRPRTIEDLIQRKESLVVLANSSHAELLKQLKVKHPELEWHETSKLSAVELLQQVHDQKIDFTLVDSITFAGQKSFFPGLTKAFDLSEPEPLAWMIAPNRDQSLHKALNNFFALESTQLLIAQLKDKYIDRYNPFNFYDTTTFRQDMNNRFLKLKPYFIAAEVETGIDWHLLASIAYQESHWNPDAVSPTGVKGIMMLTRAAAKEVSVTDRTDPEQSIRGGAKYLKIILRKIPERIAEPDRTWLALAGYNVGFGHLEDARILTQRAGLNPDSWQDVKQHLPLLTQENYFSKTRYGYARGYEPVHYVSNIQKYYDLLQWELQLLQASQKTDTETESEQQIEDNNKPIIPDLLPAL